MKKPKNLTVENPVRLVFAGGFLGSGKTTALGALAKRLLDKGLRIGIITNDQSGNLADTLIVRQMLDQLNVPVEEVVEGCFCCKFDELVEALQDEDIPMATLAVKEEDMDLLDDSNVVKVVSDEKSFALNFSRFPLSFPASEYFWRHIGIYGYQKDFLFKFCRIPPSGREKAEKLEQLRAMENGYRIKIVESSHSPLSVDTPEDIIRVENILKEVNS